MSKDLEKKLFQTFQTPTHVIAHCKQVGRLAKQIATAYKEAGYEINPELVELAGNIHDFARVVDFKELPTNLGTKEQQSTWKNLRTKYQGLHHAKVGEQVLQESGYPILAKIIGRHHFGAIASSNPPENLEEKIIFYADKRVAHDKVVSLRDRLAEARKRHHQNANSTLSPQEKEIYQKIEQLEEELFKDITLTPNDLN
jgi:uncharacterized protein